MKPIDLLAHFERFVSNLEQVAIAALESSQIDKAAKATFLKVARLEHDFWQMAWLGGEE